MNKINATITAQIIVICAKYFPTASIQIEGGTYTRYGVSFKLTENVDNFTTEIAFEVLVKDDKLCVNYIKTRLWNIEAYKGLNKVLKKIPRIGLETESIIE